jgi:hypothetical protein
MSKNKFRNIPKIITTIYIVRLQTSENTAIVRNKLNLLQQKQQKRLNTFVFTFKFCFCQSLKKTCVF